MKLIKDVTRLSLAEIIAKALDRNKINKIAVRTDLFSLNDVEEEFARQSSKEELVQYILHCHHESDVLHAAVKRSELLRIINAFSVALPLNSRKKVQEAMEHDEYVFENGSFKHIEDVEENVTHVENMEEAYDVKVEPVEDTISVSKKEHIRSIGNGYFSSVSSYRDEMTNRKFARKKLLKEHWENQDYILRFQREIDFLKQLQGNPHVVNLLDYNLDHKEYWYDMELADTNLLDFIRKHNDNKDKLPLHMRLMIFEQILIAIREAHQRGIIHRDLCPKNILIWDYANFFILVKVADFGLGKSEKELQQYTKSALKDYGHILYVAPEQREQLKAANNKSDLFSLGRLLEFILTGRDPDSHDSNIPFAQLINKATQSNPAERYETVDQMHKEYLNMKDEYYSSSVRAGQ